MSWRCSPTPRARSKPNRGADRTGNSFDPEKGVAHEVGIKYDMADRDLSLTAAMFHIVRRTC